jgi:hypothetical protein
LWTKRQRANKKLKVKLSEGIKDYLGLWVLMLCFYAICWGVWKTIISPFLPPKNMTKNMVYLKNVEVGGIKELKVYGRGSISFTPLKDDESVYWVEDLPSADYAKGEKIPKIILIKGGANERLADMRTYRFFSYGTATGGEIGQYKPKSRELIKPVDPDFLHWGYKSEHMDFIYPLE